LALATILQFAERLSDRQAADAVRSRIDRSSSQAGDSLIIDYALSPAWFAMTLTAQIVDDQLTVLCHVARDKTVAEQL
jgi:hypothetical protein